MVKLIRLSVLLTFFLLSLADARATDYTLVQSGNWNDANSWSPAGVPGAGDNVTVGGWTVNLNISGVNINNLNMNSSGYIQGGNDLAINGDFTMNGGHLENTGAVTVGGNFTWIYGWMEAGGTFSVTGSTSIQGVAGNPIYLHRQLSLDGGGSWTSGDISVFLMGTFKVPTGATLTANSSGPIQFLCDLNNPSNHGNVQIYGTMTKTGSGMLAIYKVYFENYGTLQLQGGTMLFNGGGIFNGTISTDSGTTLQLDNPADNTNYFYNQTSGTITCNGLLQLFKHLTIFQMASNGNSFNNIEIKGGDFQVNGDNVTMTSLNLQNDANGIGDISGSANYTITSDFNFVSGQAQNLGTISVGGNLNWSGGQMSNTSGSAGDVTVTGITTIAPNSVSLYRKMKMDGGGSWSGGSIDCAYNGGLEIPAGTTFTAYGNDNNITGGSGQFLINGTFIKTGSGACSINIPYIQNTPATVQQGTLIIGTQGGTLNANLTCNAGTTLQFSGTVTQSSGNVLCGNANFVQWFGNSVLTSPGNTFNTATVTGGTLTVNYPNISFTSLNFNGYGALGGSTNATITGNLTMSDGFLYNTGTVVVNGNFIWSGGTIGDSANDGDMSVNGTTSISGFSSKLIRRTLVTNGGGTWDSGNITFCPYGILRIPVASTFTATVNADANLSSGCSSGGILEVQGTFIKQGNANLSCQIAYNNTGTTHVTGGGWLLFGPSSINGLIQCDANTTLELDGNCTQTSGTINCQNALFKQKNGVSSISSATNIFGTGFVSGGGLTVNSPTITFSSLTFNGYGLLDGPTALTVTGNLTMDLGLLQNTGTVTVNGGFNWSGGVLGNGSSYGDMTVNGVTTMTIGSFPYFKDIRRKLILQGGGTWSGGDNIYFCPGGVLRIPTAAAFTATINADVNLTTGCNSGGAFDVQGTFVKTGNATLYCNEDFTNSGTVSIQSGKFDVNAPFNNSGVIKGNGTLDLGYPNTNTGTFAPGLSPGTLAVIGDYPNSTLEFEIKETGGTVSKDLLSVTGNMNLNGALNISHLGGTIPMGTYDIAVCSGTRSGTFSTVNYPTNCNGNCSIAYTGTKAQLVLAAPLPLELISISVVVYHAVAQLDWRTAQEKNVQGFEIERSADGILWTGIGNLPAHNQPGEQVYHFEDSGVQKASGSSKAYYRLKMTDLNGAFTYSPICSVALPGATGIRVYPNPARDVLEVQHLTAPGTLQLTDPSGRVLLTQPVDGDQQACTLHLPASEDGIYLLQWNAENGQRESVRVVVKH
jgi:hypothetical protein